MRTPLSRQPPRGPEVVSHPCTAIRREEWKIGMGGERRVTGAALPLEGRIQRTLFSPNASRPMFQNPREMGQFGTRGFGGDVPKTQGNGTHWNIAAGEGRRGQWEGPIEETARTEDALVLGLVELGLLRLARGESGVSPETGKSAGPDIECVRQRLPAPVSMRFVQFALGVGVRLERALGAISGTVPASFAPPIGVVSMSGGCTGIQSLIPTCTFTRGRRRTDGQKGSGP